MIDFIWFSSLKEGI